MYFMNLTKMDSASYRIAASRGPRLLGRVAAIALLAIALLQPKLAFAGGAYDLQVKRIHTYLTYKNPIVAGRLYFEALITGDERLGLLLALEIVSHQRAHPDEGTISLVPVASSDAASAALAATQQSQFSFLRTYTPGQVQAFAARVRGILADPSTDDDNALERLKADRGVSSSGRLLGDYEAFKVHGVRPSTPSKLVGVRRSGEELAPDGAMTVPVFAHVFGYDPPASPSPTGSPAPRPTVSEVTPPRPARAGHLPLDLTPESTTSRLTARGTSTLGVGGASRSLLFDELPPVASACGGGGVKAERSPELGFGSSFVNLDNGDGQCGAPDCVPPASAACLGSAEVGDQKVSPLDTK